MVTILKHLKVVPHNSDDKLSKCQFYQHFANSFSVFTIRVLCSFLTKWNCKKAAHNYVGEIDSSFERSQYQWDTKKENDYYFSKKFFWIKSRIWGRWFFLTFSPPISEKILKCDSCFYWEAFHWKLTGQTCSKYFNLLLMVFKQDRKDVFINFYDDVNGNCCCDDKRVSLDHLHINLQSYLKLNKTVLSKKHRI